ncbi:hypothetical protein [Maricaulis parjimensis]|uniref:hypothetical protein n=1 Tax=Maricaulis parjimensis TaxID=144023 RepID=UPI001939F62A|nr:hypothetical protein [Maricaulis parjimensis]
MTRIWLAFLMSLLVSAGAHALGGGGAEPPPSSGHGSSSQQSGNRFSLFFNRSDSEEDADADAEEDDDPRAFNLPALVVPLSSHGRLTGFAYVNVRVRATDGQNVWDMQENFHFALDALVRACYRTPVSTEDGSGLDEERAIELWQEVLQDFYGANSIDWVEIRASDTRLLRR